MDLCSERWLCIFGDEVNADEKEKYKRKEDIIFFFFFTVKLNKEEMTTVFVRH